MPAQDCPGISKIIEIVYIMYLNYIFPKIWGLADFNNLNNVNPLPDDQTFPKGASHRCFYMHTYIYIYIYMYTYTHIHTYTHTDICTDVYIVFYDTEALVTPLRRRRPRAAKCLAGTSEPRSSTRVHDRIPALPIINQEYTIINKEYTIINKEYTIIKKEHTIIDKEYTIIPIV